MTPYRNKAEHVPPSIPLATRILAKAIDLLVVVALGVSIPFRLGPVFGFAYSLLADGIRFKALRGQSIGKQLLKIQVVDPRTEKPIGYKKSILRNAPIGVAAFFAIIPFWGWILCFLTGLPLFLMEIYLMATAPKGHRLGDVMADTEVVPKRPDLGED